MEKFNELLDKLENIKRFSTVADLVKHEDIIVVVKELRDYWDTTITNKTQTTNASNDEENKKETPSVGEAAPEESKAEQTPPTDKGATQTDVGPNEAKDSNSEAVPEDRKAETTATNEPSEQPAEEKGGNSLADRVTILEQKVQKIREKLRITD